MVINYSVITTRGEDDPAGINGIMAATHGSPYIVAVDVQVDDIEARLKKAVALGGKVIVPVMTVPKAVTFALLANPPGNCIGLAASQTPD